MEIFNPYYANEDWKPIRFFKGYYEVSSHGRVRSMDYKRKGLVKIIRHNNPHNPTKLNLSSPRFEVNSWSVKMMVARAFLPKPLPEDTDVICLNEKLWDFRASNLVWVTRKNLKRIRSEKARYTTQLVGCNSIVVAAKERSRKISRVFNSVREAAQEYAVNGRVIKRAAKNKLIFQGYRWAILSRDKFDIGMLLSNNFEDYVD